MNDEDIKILEEIINLYKNTNELQYKFNLEYELTNKTGIKYMQIPNKYCPMYGRKLGR